MNIFYLIQVLRRKPRMKTKNQRKTTYGQNLYFKLNSKQYEVFIRLSFTKIYLLFRNNQEIQQKQFGKCQRFFIPRGNSSRSDRCQGSRWTNRSGSKAGNTKKVPLQLFNSFKDLKMLLFHQKNYDKCKYWKFPRADIYCEHFKKGSSW
ncbi:unnamed protein product [Paramecium sonneborni]|uniref:Uncharacterized protein n=1 Tax=Paramecium sonneborni TaxID=65129 RepID=A0A8S1LPQ2_9CILI|nr:unnamed protein product [Paramecium sonneborni]